MKVLFIFGTRPEAIKMCPVIKEAKRHQEIESLVCLTGQHEEMLKQVMDVFQVKAEYNLHIMKDNQTITSITMEVLTRLDQILEQEKIDFILVHGDTTTSFAAALAGFYHNIPIGHIEAGLRTFNMKSPYPEEFNRQAVDLISSFYFAPTEQARQNLIKEGKKEDYIFVTGNTVIDALLTTVRKNYYNSHLEWAKNSKLILLTTHRRENIGQPMKNIFSALNRIIKEHNDVKIIFPIHKNPKVRKIAGEILNKEENIKIIEPLDVYDFHNFMARSYLLLTDSGGIQEEAPALGKPVLVLRDTTERPEGIEAGTLKLIGTTEEGVYKNTKELLTNKTLYEQMSKASNPYGDGHSSQRIIQILLERFVNKNI